MKKSPNQILIAVLLIIGLILLVNLPLSIVPFPERELSFINNEDKVIYLDIPKYANVSKADITISSSASKGLFDSTEEIATYSRKWASGLLSQPPEICTLMTVVDDGKQLIEVRITEGSLHSAMRIRDTDYNLLEEFPSMKLATSKFYSKGRMLAICIVAVSYPSGGYEMAYRYQNKHPMKTILGPIVNGYMPTFPYSPSVQITTLQELSDVSVSLGSTKLFGISGAKYTQTNKLSDFSQTLNSYLEKCVYENNICKVPLTFHSDTSGRLKVSDINIDYEIIEPQVQPTHQPINQSTQTSKPNQVPTNTSDSAIITDKITNTNIIIWVSITASILFVVIYSLRRKK